MTDNDTYAPETTWTKAGHPLYRVEIHLTLDGDRYVSHVSQLPGVVGQGKDTFDAVANATVALRGVLVGYAHFGMSIPWREDDPLRTGESGVWVDVEGPKPNPENLRGGNSGSSGS